MTAMPELEPSEHDAAAQLVRDQAELLYRRSRWVEISGVVGAGLLFGALAYLWSDFRGGWGHSPTWQPALGALVGAALGFGVMRPLAEWLRLQARLAHVQLELELHSRETRISSARSAHRIDTLVEAGLTGEWQASWSGNFPVE